MSKSEKWKEIDRINELSDKLRDYFDPDDWKFKIRRTWRNIKQAWKWFKVGYYDYDWDFQSIIDVLDFKLTNMRDYFATSDIAEGDEQRAREIDEALYLIDLLNENEFAEEERAAHEKRWGEFKHEFIPVMPEHPRTTYEWKAWFTKAKDETEEEQARQELIEIMRLEHERYSETFRKLFEIIGEFAQGWWN